MLGKPKKLFFQAVSHFTSTMLMNKLRCLGVILSVICAPGIDWGANAAPLPTRALTEIGHREKVRLNVGKEFSIEVVQDAAHQDEAFSEDWLLLLIMDTSNKVVAKRAFHSTYQKFRIDVMDLDGDGNDEFVFITGEGRGTSARKEALSIERLQGGKLRTVLSLPISDYYAGGKKWWYSIVYRDSGKHTTDIELRLDADDSTGYEHSPPERIITIRWVLGAEGNKLIKILLKNPPFSENQLREAPSKMPPEKSKSFVLESISYKVLDVLGSGTFSAESIKREIELIAPQKPRQ